MMTQVADQPLGGEVFMQLTDRLGTPVTLTYNDLWMLIVCRASMENDWIQMRRAASTVTDAAAKSDLAQRLWELEQVLGGLPEIPREVQKRHLHRAHVWFTRHTVCQDSRW